jgi:hypothetical protein
MRRCDQPPRMTDTPTPFLRHPPQQLRSAALWLLTAVMLWVSFLSFPIRTADDHLDSSWMQALGYALKHGLQAGTDVAFVYSPIGYFLTLVYDSDLFTGRILWELLVGAALAVTFTVLLSRIPQRSRRIALLALLLLFVPYQRDPLYLLAIVALTLLLARGRPRLAGLGAALALLAVISTTKFTYLMLTAVCVLAIAWATARQRSVGAAAAVCAAFLGCFVGAWALFDQSPRNIPAFVATSIEVARGYNDAMMRDGSLLELSLGVIVLLLALTSVLLATTIKPMRARRLLVATVMTGSLFLVWKHGFVRQDKGHVLVFFTFTATSVLILPGNVVLASGSSRRRTMAMTTAACVGLGLVGFFRRVPPWEFARVRAGHIAHNVMVLRSSDELRDRLEQNRARLKRLYDLPATRTAVGSNTIDLFSYEQGVLLLNELSYHPRPLLQSCSAYTPAMLARDARFLERADAPAFVLLKLQTIDRRMPVVDDCDALRVVLRDYIPVLTERGYILFRRSPRQGIRLQPVGGRPRSIEAMLGQSVSLSPLIGNTHFLSLGIDYTLPGMIAGLLYKPPPLYLEVRADDDTHYRFRIPRGMVRTGFVIDPLILGQSELLSWYLGEPLKRPTTIRVTSDRPARLLVRPVVRVRLESYQATMPHVSEAVSLAPLCFMFKTPPDAVVSIHPADCWPVEGEKVLMVHAPGQIRFKVQRGLHRLSGRFGMAPGAYEEGQTDGVLFRVKVICGNAEEVLFERYLDPLNTQADRGFQRLHLRFATEDSADVILETTVGPHGDDGWDWSFWTDVEVCTDPADS